MTANCKILKFNSHNLVDVCVRAPVDMCFQQIRHEYIIQNKGHYIFFLLVKTWNIQVFISQEFFKVFIK